MASMTLVLMDSTSLQRPMPVVANSDVSPLPRQVSPVNLPRALMVYRCMRIRLLHMFNHQLQVRIYSLLQLTAGGLMSNLNDLVGNSAMGNLAMQYGASQLIDSLKIGLISIIILKNEPNRIHSLRCLAPNLELEEASLSVWRRREKIET